MKSATFLACFALMHIAGAGHAADAEQLNPEKTWVFAVGVIQYDHSGLKSWPDEGRVDARMIDAFRRRGVPEKQISFLQNKEGTKANIEEKLSAFVRRPGPEDTLLFYYTGHGFQDRSKPNGEFTFVTYDTKSKWTVGSIVGAIGKNFRGKRLILAADCCHSGALAVEAKRARGLPATAVLTSSQHNSISTGNWTFTECLVDAVQGNAALDADKDGGVTFEEAAAHAKAEMAFSENQRTESATLAAFPAKFVLAPAIGKATGRIGERCEGEFEGKWYKAKVIGEEQGKFRVTWPGWDKTQDAWLPATKLRPFQPQMTAPGTAVEVEWGGKWFPGTVLQAEAGLHLVHYAGYPASDDEWVTPARLRPASSNK